jgi:predicted molibdopterin-dependent oxidoreductase YjgC
MTYKRIGADDRVDHAAVRQGGVLVPVAFDEALADAASRVRRVVEQKGAGSVGLLVSPHATNEDLFVAKRFAAALGTAQTGFTVVRGRHDDILIEAEKAPNAAGARALGFDEAAGLAARLRGGAVEALVVMGHDVLATGGDEILAALASVDTIVLLDTHRSHLETLAHVLLPARVAAEKDGSLTNSAGRVQRVRPAVEPSFDARAEGEILWRLAQALGLAGFEEAWDAGAVSKMLAQTEPAFAGRDVDSLPAHGAPLAGAGS